MDTRKEYVRKLQEKLEEWDLEIDALTARAGKVSAGITNEYHEQIETLKTKQAAAREKIEELQRAGEHAWGDMKSGIELSLVAMVEALDSARSRFKK